MDHGRITPLVPAVWSCRFLVPVASPARHRLEGNVSWQHQPGRLLPVSLCPLKPILKPAGRGPPPSGQPVAKPGTRFWTCRFVRALGGTLDENLFAFHLDQDALTASELFACAR